VFKLHLSLLAAVLLLAGCQSVPLTQRGAFTHFVGLDNLSDFTRSRNGDGSVVLLSPEIKARLLWNQLVVSWNADAPAGTSLIVEAAAIGDGVPTKFYTLGRWSLDGKSFPRTSVRGQKDANGNVTTDTLVLNHPADGVQVRVTLGGTGGALPTLKFLGLSFANVSKQEPPWLQATPETRRQDAGAPTAWGMLIDTPERSQHGYPHANGWCSPAAVAMVLAHWGDVLRRPEMNLTVPQVAAAVYDTNYASTGNWPFNTALAGSFSDMRGYVTRFDDLSEVEDWIACGVPVILSARWDWLKPGRPFDPDGHLIVVIGFTANGDVVVNDPSAHTDRGESIRQIYRRADVVQAWASSHHAVYLIYPAGAEIPPNRCGHW